MPTTRRRTATAALALAAGLTACGGGSSSGGAGTQTQPTSSRPSFDPEQNTKIQKCLRAAGIKLPKAPSGAGGFNGAPPSNFSPPSKFTPPAGANGGAFNNPKVQQALKACGISLPSAPGQ